MGRYGFRKERSRYRAVVERDMVRIARDLSVAQMALLVNNEGVTVRVTSDPRDHTFRYAEVPDSDD